MPGTMITIIIAVVVVGAVAAAVAYYIIRFTRGSIALSLPRTAFSPGETIDGSFTLLTKKALAGNRLIVSLIGRQVTRTYEDGKTRTRSREMYRDEVLVEEARSYPAGHRQRYDFEIAVPDPGSSSFMNSQLGQALAAAMQLLSNRETRLEWKLEARLDAKGVDLADGESVRVNL